MLSVSFQGGLFNLLGFVVEQNSATNSLRGTVRKKAEKWGRKVILACIAKNLHMNEHVCTSLCIKWKSSVCRGKTSEKSIYTLGSSWFHWNSGKSKATEILVISVFTGQSFFRHSTHSAPQLSGLEQLSPKPPLCWDLWLNLNLVGNAVSRVCFQEHRQASENNFNMNKHPTSNKYFGQILPTQNSLEFCYHEVLIPAMQTKASASL